MSNVEKYSKYIALITKRHNRKGKGTLVKTKSGKIGRTFNADNRINDKVPVYLAKGQMLCDKFSVKIIGYID